MNDTTALTAGAWGLVPTLAALRGRRMRAAAAWAALTAALWLGGLLAAPRVSFRRAAGVPAAWAAMLAAPLLFRAARRRAERRFRGRLRVMRGRLRHAAAGRDAQALALGAAQARLERIQNRFALLQAMATRLDTGGILRNLGDLWSGFPHARRCVLMHRLPNGNWSAVFAFGVDDPSAWAAFVNEHPSWVRARRARRLSPAELVPDVAERGVTGVFLFIPFVWGEDVMAVGVLELDPAAGEDAAEEFHADRKLVSIGLRRAFLYDLMSERGRHDGLTGALLRRPFLERLSDALRKRQRYGAPAALALADVDRFKAINDTRGHVAGDRALAAVADVFRRLAVPGTTLGRFGGDEFAVLLELSSFDDAMGWTEAFRAAVAAERIQEEGEVFGVTLSVGLAEALPRDAAEALLQRADQALYAAKAAGRDRVHAARAQEPA